MDPFAVLGLASSIVQFIGLAAKLMDSSRAINHVPGVAADNEKLEFVINILKNLSKQLACKPSPRLGDDEALLGLADECRILSNDILNLFERVEVEGRSPQHLTAAATLKIVWKDSEGTELEDRLNSCCSQLQPQLAALLRFLHPIAKP
jgi:hypothetical protein